MALNNTAIQQVWSVKDIHDSFIDAHVTIVAFCESTKDRESVFHVFESLIEWKKKLFFDAFDVRFMYAMVDADAPIYANAVTDVWIMEKLPLPCVKVYYKSTEGFTILRDVRKNSLCVRLQTILEIQSTDVYQKATRATMKMRMSPDSKVETVLPVEYAWISKRMLGMVVYSYKIKVQDKTTKQIVEKDVQLGRGSYGRVIKGRYLEVDVAIKIPVQRMSSRDDYNDYVRELVNMQSLQHPNIQTLMGICEWRDETDNQIKLCFVQPFRKETLTTAIDRLQRPTLSTGRVADRLRWKWILGLAKALAYMHGQRCVHFDVKPANILMSDSNEVLLSDLGFSRFFSPIIGVYTPDVFGTLEYASPEGLDAKLRLLLNPSTDVYAFGLLAFEIFAPHSLRQEFLEQAKLVYPKEFVRECSKYVEGSQEYTNALMEFFRTYVVKGIIANTIGIQGRPYETTYAPKDLQFLLLRCIQRNPQARPQMTGVLSDLVPLFNVKEISWKKEDDAYSTFGWKA
jgi:hypothetical protein